MWINLVILNRAGIIALRLRLPSDHNNSPISSGFNLFLALAEKAFESWVMSITQTQGARGG